PPQSSSVSSPFNSPSVQLAVSSNLNSGGEQESGRPMATTQSSEACATALTKRPNTRQSYPKSPLPKGVRARRARRCGRPSEPAVPAHFSGYPNDAAFQPHGAPRRVPPTPRERDLSAAMSERVLHMDAPPGGCTRVPAHGEPDSDPQHLARRFHRRALLRQDANHGRKLHRARTLGLLRRAAFPPRDPGLHDPVRLPA